MNPKRPQRYLLMILSSAGVIWIVLRLLPWRIALGLAAAVVLIALVLCVWARHMLLGRLRLRRRRWAKAVESFQRFEKMLLTNRFAGWLAPLHLGIFTLDGVARTRNLIGESLLHLERLDDAEGWLRSALQRDPMYAVPYAHLGTIAALRSQDAVAHRNFQKAVDLGFSPVAAEQMLRRARHRANKSAEAPAD